MEEFRTEKTEELEWQLKFLTIKNRSFKNLSDYEEEKEVKKSDEKSHGRNRQISDKNKEFKRINNRYNRTWLW